MGGTLGFSGNARREKFEDNQSENDKVYTGQRVLFLLFGDITVRLCSALHLL